MTFQGLWESLGRCVLYSFQGGGGFEKRLAGRCEAAVPASLRSPLRAHSPFLVFCQNFPYGFLITHQAHGWVWETRVCPALGG